LEDILREQPPLTQAVIGMVIEGFTDIDISEELRLTHAAVRIRKTRFRKALYDAAREGRIWIPEQLHTKAGTRNRQQRGAA
jgi:DNA-directed RNA polymerase specialized sigma24 family protein